VGEWVVVLAVVVVIGAVVGKRSEQNLGLVG
jgi:hypothetical protein